MYSYARLRLPDVRFLYVVGMSEICGSIYLGNVEHMRPIGPGMWMNAHSDIVLNSKRRT